MATVIQKHGKKFRVKFYNRLTGENKFFKVKDTFEEARTQASKIETDFYGKNTSLLPKGVSVGNDEFRLHINSFSRANNKPISKFLGAAKTLKEIKELKIKCLNSIIG